MDIRKIKKIGLVYNLRLPNNNNDVFEEYDDFSTIEALKTQIEQIGYEVILLEFSNKFFDNIRNLRPDFVFNIAEGVGIGRNRESQIPCILDILGIPHSGSDALSLALTLDKYLTWQVLKSVYVPVPDTYMLRKESEVKLLKNIFRKKHLWIIKPRWEGSSKGILNDSVVDRYELLQAKVRKFFKEYKQPVVIEEFLEKDEITAGVGGNNPPRLLGMMKIKPIQANCKRFIYSLEVKRDWKRMVIYEDKNSISNLIQRRIENLALKVFEVLELRDIARIDFRLNSQDIPFVIDVNPLPGLSPLYSDLPILWKLQGRPYSELIKFILKESIERYRFN